MEYYTPEFATVYSYREWPRPTDYFQLEQGRFFFNVLKANNSWSTDIELGRSTELPFSSSWY